MYVGVILAERIAFKKPSCWSEYWVQFVLVDISENTCIGNATLHEIIVL